MAEKPGGTEITELAALKALAQPRRQQILQHLTLNGPATSAILARALGLNTGATSYHLRELARYGFVDDAAPEDVEARAAGPASSGAEGPGSRRRRWWKVVPGDRRFPPRSRQTPETRLVMDELNRHAYAADLALFEQLQRAGGQPGRTDAADPADRTDRTYVTDRTDVTDVTDVTVRTDQLGQGDEWVDAFLYSRGSIRLTLPELRAFFEEYIALTNRYKRPDAATPPEARTVHTRLLAFPAPAPADHRSETDAS